MKNQIPSLAVIYENLRGSTFYFPLEKEKKKGEIFLQRWSSSNLDEESFEDIDDDSAIDHKSLSLELMTRYLYLGDHPPTLHPSEF